MKIIWLVASLSSDRDGATSDVASVRTRALRPASALRERMPGIETQVLTFDDYGHAPISTPDLVVFGKAFEDRRSLLADLRGRDARIVLDLCDDVFSLPHLEPAYARMLPFADALVCSSRVLLERARLAVVKTCHLVPDMLEGERAPAAWAPAPDRLNLLFYGQPVNLPPLRSALAGLATLPVRCSVVVLTRWSGGRAWFEELLVESDERLDLELRQWSAIEQSAALRECDAVILPGDEEATRKAKTANRLVTALLAGKPCVAYPLPSHAEFAEYAFLDPDISRGVMRLLASPPGEVRSRCEQGQRYIEETLGDQAIAARWWSAFERTERPPPTTASSASAIKLNLGCGDKILPGYVNVDAVRERRSKRPDVVSDLRRLAVFPDGHADEILAVHVIEHFYYWEARDVMSEWIRVLKPGGRMVLESPNLLSACKALLQDPGRACRPGKEGQLSMWALYGDPSWKDPLMCHRWLYTPSSLAGLMSECGLCGVSQQPAQYKLREPRDMRLVGYKPTRSP